MYKVGCKRVKRVDIWTRTEITTGGIRDFIQQYNEYWMWYSLEWSKRDVGVTDGAHYIASGLVALFNANPIFITQ